MPGIIRLYDAIAALLMTVLPDEKVKADVGDPLAGYLDAKVDGVTIIENTVTHKIEADTTVLATVVYVNSLGLNRRGGKQAILNGLNTITFSTPYLDTNWHFDGVPLVINSLGGIVSPLISNRTANGFDLTTNDSGTLDYGTSHV